jgi:hypothetical protein
MLCRSCVLLGGPTKKVALPWQRRKAESELITPFRLLLMTAALLFAWSKWPSDTATAKPKVKGGDKYFFYDGPIAAEKKLQERRSGQFSNNE